MLECVLYVIKICIQMSTLALTIGKNTQTNKDPLLSGAVSFMQKMLTEFLHGASTPVVFTRWKLLKTRQQIGKCILPLSVSVRNHSRPVIKSH